MSKFEKVSRTYDKLTAGFKTAIANHFNQNEKIKDNYKVEVKIIKGAICAYIMDKKEYTPDNTPEEKTLYSRFNFEVVYIGENLEEVTEIVREIDNGSC